MDMSIAISLAALILGPIVYLVDAIVRRKIELYKAWIRVLTTATSTVMAEGNKLQTMVVDIASEIPNVSAAAGAAVKQIGTKK